MARGAPNGRAADLSSQPAPFESAWHAFAGLAGEGGYIVDEPSPGRLRLRRSGPPISAKTMGALMVTDPPDVVRGGLLLAYLHRLCDAAGVVLDSTEVES
jgi:hypothetical protein